MTSFPKSAQDCENIQVSLWFFLKDILQNFLQEIFENLQQRNPEERLGCWAGTAGKPRGKKECLSHPPNSFLQVSSTNQRAAGNCSRAAPAQAGLISSCRTFQRPHALHRAAQEGQEEECGSVGYWLDSEHEQQSSFGFSPLLPSLLSCSQRNMIKM